MKRKIFGILLASILFVTTALPVFALEATASLTPLQVENLAVLCKTWGLVKFYHPSCINDAEKMDKELLSLIPVIENATSSEERDAILSKWIKSLPTFESSIEPKETPDYIEDYSRSYDGSRWITSLSEDLKGQLNLLINADRTGIKKLCYLNEYGFFNFDHELQYLDLKTIDKNHRFLSLFRFWNIYEFFSPNKELLDEDWDKVLLELIPLFYSAETSVEYQAALMNMARKSCDTHASVTGTIDSFTNEYGDYVLPVSLLFIEGKVVVSHVNADTDPLKKGDIITAINGIPIETLLSQSEFYSNSNEIRRLKKAVYIIKFSHERSNQLTIDRNGKSMQLTLDYVKSGDAPMGQSDAVEAIQEIEKDVYYVNYGYLTVELEAELKGILKTAKTVIMDLRVYPKEHMSIYTSIDAFLPYQKSLHVYELPDFYNLGNFFTFSDQSSLKENPDFYKGEFICLVNESTLSHSEFTATRYRKAPKAIILGSQTAGADGDVVFIPLVGPHKILYSSIGILDVDGTETQRVGIKVDVPQIQTYEGFMNNEDDLLNAALRYAKKLNAHKVDTRIVNGVEMVSLKQALMYRPFEFQYDAASKTFTLKNGAESTTITFGSKTYPRFDGTAITLKSEPIVINGRLYVPKEYLMDVLSLKLNLK